MILAPWLIALAFVVGLLVLIPARRLRLADLSPQAVGSYAIVVWMLAMAIAVRPVGVRILVPVLLFAYLAPFVATPDQIRRLLRRRPPDLGPPDVRPPIKDVTPPDQRVGP